MPVSPSTDNYYVGKGKISFKAVGGTTFRDLGNVSSARNHANITTLEHFSSREGVKKKDMEVVTEKKMTVRHGHGRMDRRQPRDDAARRRQH